MVGSLLNWNDEKGEVFEIVIQFAAILAICWLYRRRLWTVIATLPRERRSQLFTWNLLLAFLPAAVIGVMFIGTIKKYLFAPVPVATAFIVGGILILLIESGKRTDASKLSTPSSRRMRSGWRRPDPVDDSGHFPFGSDHHGGLAARPVASRRHRIVVFSGHSHDFRRDRAGALQGASLAECR